MHPLDASAGPLWATFRDDPTNLASKWLLVEHYQPLLHRVANLKAQHDRLMGNDDLAQDLAFVLLDLIDEYDRQRAPFITWSMKILRLRVVNVMRRYDPIPYSQRCKGNNGRQLALDANHEGDDHPPAAPSFDQVRFEDRTYRRDVLGRIGSRRYRCFVLLRWWRGWSCDRIGKAMGIPAGSTRYKLQQQALEALCQAMRRTDLVGVKPNPGTGPRRRPSKKEAGDVLV